jgi:hypothetical protein
MKLHLTDVKKLMDIQVLKTFLAKLHKTYKQNGSNLSSVLGNSY